jgi:hypothetical protein
LVKAALAWPVLLAMVGWQTRQRLTGRRVTVTGKRAGPEFLIAPMMPGSPGRARLHNAARHAMRGN